MKALLLFSILISSIWLKPSVIQLAAGSSSADVMIRTLDQKRIQTNV